MKQCNNKCTSYEIVQQHFRRNGILCKSDLSCMNQIIPCVDLSPLLSVLSGIIAAVLVIQSLKLQSDGFRVVIIKEIYRTKKILDVCLGKYILPTSSALYSASCLVRTWFLKLCVMLCVCMWRISTVRTHTNLWVIYTHKKLIILRGILLYSLQNNP